MNVFYCLTILFLGWDVYCGGYLLDIRNREGSVMF